MNAAQDATESINYETCLFGCPGCGNQLPARRWYKGTVIRLEVKAPTGKWSPIQYLFVLYFLQQLTSTHTFQSFIFALSF